MYRHLIAHSSVPALVGVILAFAAPAAVAQPVPSELVAVFTLNGTPTGVPGELHYRADLDRLNGDPEVLLQANTTTTGPGTAFVDFEGTSYPAGQAAGFVSPATGQSMLVSFNPSGHLFGFEVSFDYNSTSFNRASFGHRYADEPVFTSEPSFDLIADGQWHRITRQALFVFDRPAVFGFAPDNTATQGVLLIDDVQLVALPEPAAAALLVPLAAALMRRRRVRQFGF